MGVDNKSVWIAVQVTFDITKPIVVDLSDYSFHDFFWYV
jgi:hypothetical protein